MTSPTTIQRLGAAVLLCFGLTNCMGTMGSSEVQELAQADVPQVYRLSPGDKLEINVFGEPDLSGEFDVNQNGNVTYPLLGQVEARGRTVAELRDVIAQQLNARYLVDPKVSVEVLNYRPFFILGEVNNPGSYPFQAGMNVREAVALAGGYTRRAVTSEMILIRPTEDGEVNLEVQPQTRVLPGDTIEVQRRFF
jgi:polysaccharide export outer membrane protein